MKFGEHEGCQCSHTNKAHIETALKVREDEG